jgi:hypothetical protein
MRTAIYKPSGMVTDPNELGQYPPGAARVMTNLANRETGSIEPLPGDTVITSNITANGFEVIRAWGVRELGAGGAREIVLSGDLTDSTAYELNSINESTVTEIVTNTNGLIGVPCGLSEARSRLFVAGPAVVVSTVEDLGARVATMQPISLVHMLTQHTTDAAAVAANSRVAWRATVSRRYDDGYEIVSAPSYAMYAETTASISDFEIRVGWVNITGPDRIAAGDVIRLWRTRAVASSSSTNDTYYLAQERVLVSADITARYIDIRDTALDGSLGEELYTNPGEQGARAAHGQIGVCADCAWFAKTMFYAVTSLQHFAKLTILGRYGSLVSSAERTYGIGYRAFSGTGTTIGLPTITGVTDFDGVAVGQRITSVLFSSTSEVLSFNTGAGTITMTTNASATSGAHSFGLIDSLEIDSNSLRLLGYVLFLDLWTAALEVFITTDKPINGQQLSSEDGMQFLIRAIAPSQAQFAYVATNEDNYSPRIEQVGVAGDESKNDTRLNRLLWSKLDQPEHVPDQNELTIGAGEIIRLYPTQDSLLVFCTDGLFRVYGDNGSFGVEQVDPKLVIPCQQAVDGMKDLVFAYAKDRGLLMIERSGAVTPVSMGVVESKIREEIDAVVNDDGEYEVHVVCDELHDEVTLFARETYTPAIGGGA